MVEASKFAARPRVRVALIVAAVITLAGACLVIDLLDPPETPEPLTVTVDTSGWVADLSHGIGEFVHTNCTALGESIAAIAIEDYRADAVDTRGGCTWNGSILNESIPATVEMSFVTRESNYLTDQAEWRSFLDHEVPPFAGCWVDAVVPVIVHSTYDSKIGCIKEGSYVDGRRTSIALANRSFGIVVRFTALPPAGDLGVLDDMDCCSRDDMLRATALMLSEAGNIVTHIPPTPTEN